MATAITPSKIQVYRDGRHCGYCTARRAIARVLSGRSAWRGPASIEMIASDPRQQRESAQLLLSRPGYDRTAAGSTATLRELHHVPIATPRRALGMGRNTGGFAPIRSTV
jgi:hypothetical protein